jgi:hypothetical protein
MIEEVEKGQTPTLLETDKANELIKGINALTNMSVQRGSSSDYLEVSENNSILNLQDFPQGGNANIAGDTYDIWVCVNGVAVQKKFYIAPDN